MTATTRDWHEYWNEEGETYRAVLNTPYHQSRLTMIGSMMRRHDWLGIVDFGCGDGVCLIEPFRPPGTPVRGWAIDIDPAMIESAKALLANEGSVDLQVGGVEALRAVPDQSANCVLAANVLAYLSPEETHEFYTEAQRILVPGGALIETHSNELFDMFTLNDYTVAFFGRNFDADVEDLLRCGSRGVGLMYPTRANPLNHRYILHRLGFVQVQEEYAHYHSAPPPLVQTGDAHDPELLPDTVAPADHWKIMFQCSIYGSRSLKL